MSFSVSTSIASVVTSEKLQYQHESHPHVLFGDFKKSYIVISDVIINRVAIYVNCIHTFWRRWIGDCSPSSRSRTQRRWTSAPLSPCLPSAWWTDEERPDKKRFVVRLTVFVWCWLESQEDWTEICKIFLGATVTQVEAESHCFKGHPGSRPPGSAEFHSKALKLRMSFRFLEYWICNVVVWWKRNVEFYQSLDNWTIFRF